MYSNLSFNIGLIQNSYKVVNSTILSGPYVKSVLEALHFTNGKARHFFISNNHSELYSMIESGTVDFSIQNFNYPGVLTSRGLGNITLSPIVTWMDCVLVTKVFKPKARSLHAIQSLDLFNIDVVITLAILIAAVILLTAVFKKLYNLGNGIRAPWDILSGLCSSVTRMKGGMDNKGFTNKPCYKILLLSMVVVVYLTLQWIRCLFTVDLMTYEKKPVLNSFEQLENWDLDDLGYSNEGCEGYAQAHQASRIRMMQQRGVRFGKLGMTTHRELRDHPPGRYVAFQSRLMARFMKVFFSITSVQQGETFDTHIGTSDHIFMILFARYRYMEPVKAKFLQLSFYARLEQGYFLQRAPPSSFDGIEHLSMRVPYRNQPSVLPIPFAYLFLAVAMLIGGLSLSFVVLLVEGEISPYRSGRN